MGGAATTWLSAVHSLVNSGPKSPLDNIAEKPTGINLAPWLETLKAALSHENVEKVTQVLLQTLCPCFKRAQGSDIVLELKSHVYIELMLMSINNNTYITKGMKEVHMD